MFFIFVLQKITNTSMKKVFSPSKLLLSGALMLLPLLSQAHTYWCGSGRGGSCSCGGGGYAVPLDGGISLLAAAGIGYGIRKYNKNKAKRSEK
jgi:hypothetical protein